MKTLRQQQMNRSATDCVEALTTIATDLATYWSNSVRPFALRASPFLRPPVAATLWRLELKAADRESGSIGDVTKSSTDTLELRAELQGAHDRKCLELAISCSQTEVDGSRSLCFSGRAWCLAVKPVPPFDGVVVPPLPMSPAELEGASARWRSLQSKTKKPKLVQPKSAEVSTISSAGLLPLRVSMEQIDMEDHMAGAFGRQLNASFLPDASACGDFGPLLGEAVKLALQCSPDMKVTLIEAEASPVDTSSSVHLCARRDHLDGTTVNITGWHQKRAILRAQVNLQPLC